jgi:hypothetical protein
MLCTAIRNWKTETLVMRSILPTGSWKFIVAGLALSAATSTQAFAGPAGITLTWNPSAVAVTGDGSYSFNNINTADYGNITLGATSTVGGVTSTAFTEAGLLALNTFTLNGANANTTNYNRSGANGYIEFVQFSGAGSILGTTLNPGLGTVSAGQIDSLTFTVYAAAANGTPTFGVDAAGNATLTGVSPWVTLATGSLAGQGTTTLANTVGIGLSAGANFFASFIPDATAQADGFFVSPIAFANINLLSSTTNTGSVLTPINGGQELIINGGGGNATFAAIPEPASIFALGIGLLGLGFVGRRQAS